MPKNKYRKASLQRRALRRAVGAEAAAAAVVREERIVAETFTAEDLPLEILAQIAEYLAPMTYSFAAVCSTFRRAMACVSLPVKHSLSAVLASEPESLKFFGPGCSPPAQVLTWLWNAFLRSPAQQLPGLAVRLRHPLWLDRLDKVAKKLFLKYGSVLGYAPPSRNDSPSRDGSPPRDDSPPRYRIWTDERKPPPPRITRFEALLHQVGSGHYTGDDWPAAGQRWSETGALLYLATKYGQKKTIRSCQHSGPQDRTRVWCEVLAMALLSKDREMAEKVWACFSDRVFIPAVSDGLVEKLATGPNPHGDLAWIESKRGIPFLDHCDIGMVCHHVARLASQDEWPTVMLLIRNVGRGAGGRLSDSQARKLTTALDSAPNSCEKGQALAELQRSVWPTAKWAR